MFFSRVANCWVRDEGGGGWTLTLTCHPSPHERGTSPPPPSAFPPQVRDVAIHNADNAVLLKYSYHNTVTGVKVGGQ